MLSYTPIATNDTGFFPTIHLVMEWVGQFTEHAGNSRLNAIVQIFIWIILCIFSLRPAWAILGFLLRVGWLLHKRVTNLIAQAKKHLRKAVLAQIRILLKRVEDELSAP